MTNSERLLNYALQIIEEAKLQLCDWTIGGGTVLALTYNHRLSKDIDVFIEDIQHLGRLSPRINNAADEAIDYNEETRFISLTYCEGKVDFIACPPITRLQPIKRNFYGHWLFLDHPVEIVAKKVFYRGSSIVPRDIFDLAIVYESTEKDDLIEAMLHMPDEFKKFANNFDIFLKNTPVSMHYSIENKNMVLDGGKYMIGRECDICLKMVRKILDIM